MRMIIRGEWPGPITLRRGWARAEARPWNDAFPDAHLRLIRGGGGFIAATAEELLGIGAPSVISPPLPPPTQQVWRSAGFESEADLSLYRLELDHQVPAPDHLVAVGSSDDLDEATRIDAAAFEPFWRLDRRGLEEAVGATSHADILVIHDQDGGLCAFAVLGYGIALSYLQRLAVDPPWQGRGMGRSVMRACARKARAAGAQALLLNTQMGNDRARRLYLMEGFEELPGGLELLRKSS